VVESTVALLFVTIVSLGVIEVALTLYARNVVQAAAHEGARAAIEVGTDPITATGLASHTVRQAAGGLVQDLEVSTETARVGGREVVRVVVSGRLHPPGPLPALLPIRAGSTLTGQGPVP
jgi:Flp pilus assembly protein TadG